MLQAGYNVMWVAAVPAVQHSRDGPFALNALHSCCSYTGEWLLGLNAYVFTSALVSSHYSWPGWLNFDEACEQ